MQAKIGFHQSPYKVDPDLPYTHVANRSADQRKLYGVSTKKSNKEAGTIGSESILNR